MILFLQEEKKEMGAAGDRKRKRYDSALTYVLTAIFLVLAGEVIGSILVMIPVGAIMGYRGSMIFISVESTKNAEETVARKFNQSSAVFQDNIRHSHKEMIKNFYSIF